MYELEIVMHDSCDENDYDLNFHKRSRRPNKSNI